MKHFESNWQNKEGLNFYVQGWEPEKKPKAAVALIHGFGEHTGRYAHVGGAFSQAGYALNGFDLRGHGKSGGVRGHTPSYNALMDDIADFLLLVEKRYPGVPRFLYGHSMGGNQVLNFCLRRKPDVVGAIATGAWLKLASDPPALQVTLARTMNSMMPSLTQNSDLDTAALSHDPKIAEAYIHDPLVHSKISARLFTSIYESGLWALDHAAEFPVPLLLMHGTHDRITSFAASEAFAKRAGKIVTWHPWDGLYHEIHNEPEQAEVISVMVHWLVAQLKRN
ncbi:MAG TPA: lysophospholipase [Anaerolineales bacterium]|nr:lysophospholipase [Anaerolineales bacterium]